MKKKLFLILIFVSTCFYSNGQSSEILKEINNQIYTKFTSAYTHKDLMLFSSLQDENLIRVSGDSKQIKSKAEYITGLENWWVHSEDQLTIYFRFYERIYNEAAASDIGVYRIKIENPSTPTRYAYGEFHVILSKASGNWKFLVDYDSNKNNTVGEKQFLDAKEMSDF